MSRPSDFWSRRKAGVEAEARALESQNAPEVVEDARTDEEVLAELNLAPPEELETSDAVKEFLQNDLPQRLRTRALRQLWRTNPVLANVDGLVDYGEDFTDAATVLDKMETVYQVGKGMLTAFVDEEEDETDETEDALAEAPQEAEEEDTPLIAAAEPAPALPTEPAQPAMPQRRMRFAFDEAAQT